jgi:hypothetical protein
MEEEEEDSPIEKSPVLSPNMLSPKSPTNEPLAAAIQHYYKIKGAYDKKYNASKKILADSGLSFSKIRKKLKNLRPTCVNCKRDGGTIFTINGRLLNAKCGRSDDPCALDIQIQKGRWMLLPVAAETTRVSIDSLKADIIDLKLDLLFGLKTEDQITEQFTDDKTNYKNLVKQLTMVNEAIESEHMIKLEGDVPRNIPISQFLEIKDAQLQESIVKFKDKIADYIADSDDPQVSDPILKSALEIYIEEILPIMNKMRESKYAITIMVKEDGLFVMKQIKTMLKNLDFQYEMGEIISDKK